MVIDGEIQFKTVTRAATRITGTPFYSYPYNFSADSGHAPFFKVIVEWTAYTEPAGNRGRDNGPDPNIIPDVIAREFFYKITLPDIKILDANNCYTIDLNLGVLGSEVEETSIEISGEQGYYVVNCSDPSEPVNPDLNAGRSAHFGE